MGVAQHLGIDLREYDARIRTFIPGYDRMLGAAASALDTIVRARAPLIVDLGIGTGALSERCLAVKPRARIVGIDEDAGMLAAARQRLGRKVTPLEGTFEAVDLPRCDAVTASLALHHIPTPARRRRLFRRIHGALRPGGVLISADCHPSSHPRFAAFERAGWLAHLELSYAPSAARGYLGTWAKEDHYVTLLDEIASLQRAGFDVDVVSRHLCFAVIVASR